VSRGELDPVGIDIAFGRGPADQGADRVVGEQVAVDLLADHVRALGAQHLPGAAQVGLDLIVAGLVFPAFVIGLRQQRGRGRCHLGDGGDQRDQLTGAVAVAVRHLVFDDPDITGRALVEARTGPGRLQDPLARCDAGPGVDQH
jgi:hypothetical protein